MAERDQSLFVLAKCIEPHCNCVSEFDPRKYGLAPFEMQRLIQALDFGSFGEEAHVLPPHHFFVAAMRTGHQDRHSPAQLVMAQVGQLRYHDGSLIFATINRGHPGVGPLPAFYQLRCGRLQGKCRPTEDQKRTQANTRVVAMFLGKQKWYGLEPTLVHM